MIILADIASLRVTCAGFKQIVKNLESKFEVVTCKFYSYVAKRNRDFNEYIAAKGYDAVTPVASRRRNKLDTRQIIDGTKISINSTIDTVAFAVGEGDILPIITELKMNGKEVLEIAVEESTYTDAFNGFIPVNVNYLREGYAAPTKKREKKAPKKVVVRSEKPENSYVNEINRVFDGKAILARYKK